MAVSILTLKTGERVIAELKEVYDQEGEDKKGLCLLMEEPYVLHLDTQQPQYLTEQLGTEYTVKFSKWNPYSPDWHFKIPYDCVMTISSPEKGLEQSYLQKIQQKRELENDGNTTNSTSESSSTETVDNES